MNSSFENFFQKTIVEPCRKWIFRVTWQALLVLFLALLLNLLFSYGFTTPKMWHLGKVNNDLVAEYEVLNKRVQELSNQLDVVIDHDRNLYHSVFAVDTLDIPLSWSIADDDYYSQFAYGRYSDIMIGAEKSLDILSHRLYGASVSMDQIEEIAQSKDLMVDHIPTIWPIDRSLVKHIGAYGWRLHPILRYRRMHYGVDLSGNRGTPIYATADGQVKVAEYARGYGRQVILDHMFGYKTRYAHLNKIMVKEGQWVKRGEKIGELGNTGLSKGPHLHYEVVVKGKPVNPMNYLRKDVNEEEFRQIIESVQTTTFEAD